MVLGVSSIWLHSKNSLIVFFSNNSREIQGRVPAPKVVAADGQATPVCNIGAGELVQNL